MSTEIDSTSKYYIETSIEIQASVSTVWTTLTATSNYSEWNAFIPAVTGPLSVGSILNIVIHVPSEKKQNYKVKILAINEKKYLQWLGHFMIPGLIDGNHAFELISTSENSTLLIQKESFKGLLVPFVWNSFLNTKLRSGFVLLNSSLKNYVENKKA